MNREEFATWTMALKTYYPRENLLPNNQAMELWYKQLQDIPYDVCGLCLDTGHLYYSGMDPVTYLKKYQDKLDYVHFKDVDQKVYEEVLGEHIRFFDGCGKGAMCPIGTGALDYPAIKQALEDIGYSGYITIEQERDPRNSDTSLRDVKASVDYLKSVGYEI